MTTSTSSTQAMPVRAEFIFSSGSRELHAHGVRETITVPAVNGDAADSPLQQQVRAAFDRARKAGMENPVVVGAIPFDVNQPSQLYVPETAAWQEADPSVHAQAMPMPALRSMDTVPDQYGFQQGVANAIAAFPAEGIHKVVLSITSRLHFTGSVHVAALRTNLRRLNPSGYLFQVPLPGNIHLVGVSPELLIERRGATVQSNPLAGSARPGTVISSYKEAGLPSNGINISASMMQLMNSLNTMLIVAVALVVAIVLAVVAILALRYTVFAAIETDLAQIAVLKAIGAPLRGIRRLYVAKYLALSAVGATLGYAVGQSLATALEAPTTLYLGRPATTPWSVGLPILTVLVLALGVIGFTWLALRRIGRISAIEALRSGTSASLRPRRQRWRLAALRRLPVQVWLGAREALRPSNALLLGVLALCTFTMVLPTNVSTTLSNPQVATYLGAGRADLRIDVRAGVQDLAAVEKAVDSDPRVTRHATMLRRSYKMSSAAGRWEPVIIDIGNHEAFPMKYISGRGPSTDDEVSLSYSQAEATGAKEGSTVTVQTADGNKDLTVTGVYQDITNNGKTAKATFDDGAPALWQIIYADAHSTDQASAFARDLNEKYPGIQAIGMNQYASQFFGATGSQVHRITMMACVIALGLSFLITVLFTVLIVSRERPQLGVLLALGCTRGAVARQYLIRFGVLALTGIALGLLGTFTLGGSAIGAVMSSRGAPDLQLLPNLWLVGLVLPGALLATVIGAVALALRRLHTMPLSTTLTTGE